MRVTAEAQRLLLHMPLAAVVAAATRGLNYEFCVLIGR